MKKKRKEFIGGRLVSRDEVVKELGDPSTWEAEHKALEREQRKPYPCKKHPKYNAIASPFSGCRQCIAIWKWRKLSERQ